MEGIRAAVGGYGVRESATMLVEAILGAVLLWYLIAYFLSPLRQYPGPFLAGWTNLWRMYHVRHGKYHEVIHKLHKKYGPVVRIGPNVLDLDYPELTKTIYNTKADYLKTEFYHGSSAKSNGTIIYNLFSETRRDAHAREKRPISKHYSMTGVLPLEPHIDEMIQYLCQRLDENFVNGSGTTKVCELDDWTAFFTWDVVGKATFSKPIGYLEKGYDFDKTLNTANLALDYFALVGQYPILDYFFDKNPVYRIGPPSFGTVTNISIQHLVDRLQNKDTEYHDPSKPDFLDKFIEAKQTHPDIVNDMQIVSYLMINMIAGADTTAITINAALYFALKHPKVWERLREEIPAQNVAAGTSVVSYETARANPYLHAVVREAMRCHPGVAMLLERYVPEEGLTLPDGRYVSAGSIVGLNPHVVGRNPSVWGQDAESFRPERWLRDESQETEEEYQARLRKMDNADLAFGGGSRICIGRNLGLVQVYKVLATLISRYNIELAYPDKEWKTHNSWFHRQSGIQVKLSHRS